ncbi:MAG: T9SS type A sorting domain-containing protein [Chlorobi bacterium]|nr:T9SS type A sorting domain-containing protein [Chlorobiota bacterium]
MKKFTFIFIFSLVLIFSSNAQTVDWSLYLSRDYPTGIAFDENDSLWFIVQGSGFFEKSGSSVTDHTSGIVSSNVVGISRDGSDFWISAYGGVSKYDGTGYTNFPSGNSGDELSDNGITDIAAKNGDVLAAGETTGAYFYDGNNWTTYTTSDGIKGAFFTRVCFDNNGKGYLLGVDIYNEDKGYVNVFDGTSWTSYDSTSNMIVVSPSAIYCDSDNNIWVGGDNALSKFDGNSWTTVATMPEDDYQEIYSITEDSYGNIWFADKNSGVYYYDGNTVFDAGAPDTFGSGKAEGIASDSNGNVYVCLNSGIYKAEAENVSVGENTDKFNIYPNPAGNSLNISLNNNGMQTKVELTTISGKTVMSQYYTGNNIKINTESFDNGIYLLKINDGMVRKVVISKN